MIDKIKAEIDNHWQNEDDEMADYLRNTFLKWAEELEKELKFIIGKHLMADFENETTLKKQYIVYEPFLKDLQKAFHGR